MVAEVQYGLVVWEPFWFPSRQQRASVKKKGTDRKAKNEQKDHIENGNRISFVTHDICSDEYPKLRENNEVKTRT